MYALASRQNAEHRFLSCNITNGKVGSELEWLCFVESITRRGKRFSSEIVQTIELDGSKWAEKGYVPIFGAPSWLVDRERDLYGYSRRVNVLWRR